MGYKVFGDEGVIGPTLIENLFPSGSYRYFPVRVICGKAVTPATRDRMAKGDTLILNVVYEQGE